MPAKNKIKIFRRPASQKDDLEDDVATWILQQSGAGYIVQSMMQTTDVVTTYAASYVDWEDIPYITVTIIATYIPKV